MGYEPNVSRTIRGHLCQVGWKLTRPHPFIRKWRTCTTTYVHVYQRYSYHWYGIPMVHMVHMVHIMVHCKAIPLVPWHHLGTCVVRTYYTRVLLASMVLHVFQLFFEIMLARFVHVHVTIILVPWYVRTTRVTWYCRHRCPSWNRSVLWFLLCWQRSRVSPLQLSACVSSPFRDTRWKCYMYIHVYVHVYVHHL